MITAPYNFVPLNDKVFFPSWADDVSHDVPFKDGKSGCIDITITAKSPIFVGDHQNKEQFCNYNGQYYIPGSSVKGMIRTLLEIISYSKLRLQDKTLSYRDLNHPSYKKKAMDSNKIYMGWLYKDNETIKIDSVGKITANETRIKYKDMKKFLENELVDKIANTNESYKKYSLIKDRNLLKTSEGTIVFTGKVGDKKTREFLFPNKILNTFTIDKELFNTFKEAYYIDTPNESKDWKNLWSSEFKKGKRIPVFFQMTNENTIKHFGLSMLYKLPYENSLQKLLKKYQDFDSRLDLSETIFGFVNDETTDSLKGRVNFSHFKAVDTKKFNKKVSLPLSTPRATFFPNYLVQCVSNGKTQNYVTYDNPNAILRGFKFYPPKKNLITFDEICNKNKNVCTSFHPLDKNTIFKGKVTFHNLLPQELGALLSALNFIGNDNKYFHKIGMAKAYGFGTTTIEITNFNTNSKKEKTSEYIDKFINSINKELDIDLLNEPRIKALFKLSNYSFNEKDLAIMNVKGFVNAKKPFNKFVLNEIENNSYDKSKLCKKLNSSNNSKQKSKNNKTSMSKKSDSNTLKDFFNNR